VGFPREAREANKINGLRNRLGKNGFIVLQRLFKTVAQTSAANQKKPRGA
jgi:hypothetical protein